MGVTSNSGSAAGNGAAASTLLVLPGLVAKTRLMPSIAMLLVAGCGCIMVGGGLTAAANPAVLIGEFKLRLEIPSTINITLFNH